MPVIRTVFRRLVAPLVMVTDERGIWKKSAKNSTTAWLALPSTGGAVSASFSASPTAPVIAFFLARGCTLTAKLTPSARSWSGITASVSLQKWPYQRGRTLNLLQSLLQHRETCPCTAHPFG